METDKIIKKLIEGGLEQYRDNILLKMEIKSLLSMVTELYSKVYSYNKTKVREIFESKLSEEFKKLTPEHKKKLENLVKLTQ